jgi:antitoxin YefM
MGLRARACRVLLRVWAASRCQPCAGGERLFDFRCLLTRILVMAETLSLASVKARFSELVDRVERQQDRVVVTRNGKPAAVLISADDLESLEETLAVMSDRSVAAQVRESEKQAAAGESGASLDGLRADLARRRSGTK